MSRKAVRVVLLALVAAAVGGYYVLRARPGALVMTGIVTTHEVIVSSQVAGQIGELRVKEGDVIARGHVLGVIVPDELRADSDYYARTAEGASSQVAESAAAVRYQEQQVDAQVRQADATVASAEAAQASAEADLENARLTYERNQKLTTQGVVSTEQFDQSRTAYDALKAHVASLAKQVDSAKASAALARADAEQVTVRRSQLQTSEHASAAAQAQRAKADVRLAHAELAAPVDGVVETLAAREGEVVQAGQPILTIVNPDDLWIRADVEESYIERVRIGDHLTVRLPSGAEVPGTVIYRAVDAGFATQRDVSRIKRDVKTFEIRVRIDNRERRLAVGMTAYVLLPL